MTINNPSPGYPLKSGINSKYRRANGETNSSIYLYFYGIGKTHTPRPLHRQLPSPQGVRRSTASRPEDPRHIHPSWPRHHHLSPIIPHQCILFHRKRPGCPQTVRLNLPTKPRVLDRSHIRLRQQRDAQSGVGCFPHHADERSQHRPCHSHHGSIRLR